MSYKFRFEEKRKPSSTRQMILWMAKFGNHGRPIKYKSDADVIRFFEANGYDWDELLEVCRKPDEIVPIVENLAGSTWVVSTSGTGKASIVSDAATEQEREIVSVEGPGLLTMSTYLQLFESAASNLNRCMDNASFADFQSCVSSGIASIDGYLTHRQIIYNSGSPSVSLADNKEHKVSQDTKIDEWVPIMSGGKKLDKSGINWLNYKKLRSIRDDYAIHVKEPAYAIGYNDLVGYLNIFRYGIAGLLINLHQVFSEKVPCMIVRYAYLPDIKLLELPD
jgi:hypothetical protein